MGREENACVRRRCSRWKQAQNVERGPVVRDDAGGAGVRVWKGVICGAPRTEVWHLRFGCGASACKEIGTKVTMLISKLFGRCLGSGNLEVNKPHDVGILPGVGP